ncbi:hypothetical protein HG536_0A02160 [Torulaspora globosa]|uniref:tRNA wybutosine-synthesizing protein 2 n=1 Tax=Torulaspora globosa TaxID=48254 RepID=A0A7G3ZA63_9SACH|nr:uncharacterized protein HG536_0A02160 [Torulaspora globosa]QLL30399.1 hypothetical protein HG536_0A02160 [Torulaspora globosa]
MPYEILVDDAKLVKPIKTRLEGQRCFVKPIYRDGDRRVIRTTIDDEHDPLIADFCKRFYRSEVPDDTGIVGFTRRFLESEGCEQTEALLDCLPRRYTIYSPLLLFNHSTHRSFEHPAWRSYFSEVGEAAKAKYFRQMLAQLFPPEISHVATNMPIVETDVMRRPFNIAPLYGTLLSPQAGAVGQLRADPQPADFDRTLWCHVVQNGIHQLWAPMFTMFSRGNIKEKKRVLDVFPEIEGNDVVDLYAGIGYFTLSYLKRGARRVFCFELNPWSVEALRRGLDANSFSRDRCCIYNESNETCVQRISESSVRDLRVRHINLGLLPSSKAGWPLALAIVSMQQPLPVVTLHIHENVHVSAIDSGSFVAETLNQLAQLNGSYSYAAAHLEKIKTFAPDVWHVCLDVDVTLSTSHIRLS